MRHYKTIPPERQQMDRNLMKWLFARGVYPDEISKMCWGCVDESNRQIKIPRQTHFVILDRKTNNVRSLDQDSYKVIKWENGTEQDYLLRKSPIYSGFIFTKYFPLKVRDKNCGYSVTEVKDILKNDKKYSINILTFIQKCDNIEVSKEAN